MDYGSCYHYSLSIFHPEGLSCPCGQKVKNDQKPHKYRRNGLACFACKDCKKVFNIFTGTILSGIHYDRIKIVLLPRGFAQGSTTLHLSKELKLNYSNLLNWRHRLQGFAYENRDCPTLKDKAIGSDEVFINAGEKGGKTSPHG